MFCAEMENRFPNKWRNGYTALVIIEAIQVYRILAGRGARAGKMMSTINDVSRLAGVSKATVSRVLSGSRGVKEASRQAVLQAAEALNYRPNMIAQSLLSQSTGCIGVICAQDNINQTTSYLYALEKQLSQHQKHLLLRFANTSHGVMNSLEELTCGLCDNVLIIGARFPLNINRPDVVLVDCLDSEGDNSIQFDHAFAAETACHYLISQETADCADSSAEQRLCRPGAAGLQARAGKNFCRLIATWCFWITPRRRWRCRSWSITPLR